MKNKNEEREKLRQALGGACQSAHCFVWFSVGWFGFLFCFLIGSLGGNCPSDSMYEADRISNHIITQTRLTFLLQMTYFHICPQQAGLTHPS